MPATRTDPKLERQKHRQAADTATSVNAVLLKPGGYYDSQTTDSQYYPEHTSPGHATVKKRRPMWENLGSSGFVGGTKTKTPLSPTPPLPQTPLPTTIKQESLQVSASADTTTTVPQGHVVMCRFDAQEYEHMRELCDRLDVARGEVRYLEDAIHSMMLRGLHSGEEDRDVHGATSAPTHPDLDNGGLDDEDPPTRSIETQNWGNIIAGYGH